MTPEWMRFKAAVALDKSSVVDQAKRRQKSSKALKRALLEPNFSKTLRTQLIRYTERVMSREESRRAAA